MYINFKYYGITFTKMSKYVNRTEFCCLKTRVIDCIVTIYCGLNFVLWWF